nr:uncharacterized protein LOC131138358 isoform X2 [Doryrhamphus excisus]
MKMNSQIPFATRQTRLQRVPLCNNAFQVDIIEIHAATCGLRPSDNDGHESSGSVPVSQISTFQRGAGEIMAASLAQGGPCPSFMREWCVRYLCSGDSDSIQVSASDVTDFEVSQLIERINSASNDNISDLVDDVVTCGYTGIVSLENKDSMIRWRVFKQRSSHCFSLSARPSVYFRVKCSTETVIGVLLGHTRFSASYCGETPVAAWVYSLAPLMCLCICLKVAEDRWWCWWSGWRYPLLPCAVLLWDWFSLHNPV